MPTLEERVAGLETAVTALAETLKAGQEQLAGAVELLKDLVATLSPLADSVRTLTDAQGQLISVVRTLAEAQTRTEQAIETLTGRVDRLEEAVTRLTEAQTRTEQAIETLTGRVDRLEEAVTRLTEAQTRTEERLGRLEEAVTQLAEAQVRTEKRLDGEIGRREGERYERQVALKAYVLLGPGWGGRPEIRPEVPDRVNEALARAGIVPDDEANPNLADLLWWPKNLPDTVIVVEASLVIDSSDVARARRRAETLRAAGLEAHPVVVGRVLPDRVRELAAERGVEYYIEGEGPSAGLVRLRQAPRG